MIAIIVHGGASPVPPEEADAYRAGCLAALDAGWNVLEGGGSAVDAVEAAIRELESDPTFNAACGAALNADGEVELDAALMRGADLAFGAVGAARGLPHPISVARRLLDAQDARLLVAEGARRFAEEQGLELCDPADLITEKQRHSLEQQAQASGSNDTVGCVAIDAEGRLVAGTSTGGEVGVPPGRVGDSPLPGCGLYADDTIGACALSGDGEMIMRLALAKTIAEYLAAGMHPDEAAEAAIELLGERVGGEAGCIVLSLDGSVGWAHNSSDMACAYRTSAMEAAVVATRKGPARG
jgi:L-asparaginase / beta-aspartyl-peptidase